MKAWLGKGGLSRLWCGDVGSCETAQAFTKQLRQRCALLTASARRPGPAGSSNLYTEVIEAKGRRYFLKAVNPGDDRELRFYSALLGNLVRRQSPQYVIPTPLLITQTELSTIYLFPYYTVKPLRPKAFLKARGWGLLRGLAAFNAAHPATPRLQECFSVARFAPGVNRQKLHQSFSTQPREQVEALHRGLLSSCARVLERLEALGLGGAARPGSTASWPWP